MVGVVPPFSSDMPAIHSMQGKGKEEGQHTHFWGSQGWGWVPAGFACNYPNTIYTIFCQPQGPDSRCREIGFK